MAQVCAETVVQPGVERTVTPEPWQSPEGLDESFLSHVLHILWISEVATHQIQDLVLIPREQQIKRPPVSLLDASDKFFVCIFGQSPALWSLKRADILTAVRHLY